MIQRWVRETKDDGSLITWAENTPFPDKVSALAAYKRALENMADPKYAKPGVEWGISCPDLEYEEELAPAAERVQWAKEIRDVRLGKA